MATYFIVGRGLDGESKQYLSKVLSSLMDSSEWDIINISADSDSQEISSMKAAIRNANPKVLLSLGAEVSKILNENVKFINSARGKLLDYTDGNYTVKMVVTYSPKYLLTKDVTMESLGPVFLRDIEYAIKYVKGELIDISKKNLQYAKTFEEFKAYYDSYLKDAELPAYDIETNAKDPRSNAFRIVGYSLAPNGDTGIYIIREALGFKMPEDDWQKCVGLTKQYLTSRPVLVHNIMYERPATLNEWGTDISRFEDSLIKARLMLGGKIGAGLKEQCEKNLGYPDWDTDLHVYLDSLDSLQQKIKPTTKGKEREEYTILKGKGFAALYSLLKEKQERCDRFLAERGIPNAKGLTAEDKQEFDKIKLDSRLTALKEAMEALTEVVALYYPEPAETLEMIGKEATNLVDIQHDGILPYSSVPINIITRYGALDSVGTQDLNAFLSKRMDKESTPEVNLWQGYEILKANFQVGTEMELQGLYWNDSVASVLKEWLNEKAYTAIINLLRSGFLDKNIFENSRSVLLSFIKAELHTRVKEIVGEFELMNSGIKPLATGKRITWLQLLERLPKEYIDSHYEQIVAYVKENLTNKELYPDYTSMLDIFNPSSYLNVSILKDIFLTPDLQKANGVKEVIALINSGLEIDKVPYPDRSLYESYQALVKHNEAIDSGEKEGEKISAYTIYKQIAEGLFDIHARTQELQDIQKRAATYNLEDTSESTIVSIYENMVVMGCDIEDESTWTDEFRFLVNFRIFKKCLKLINVYIDGAKIGRGAVWVVNRNDLLDPDKKFAPRKRRYTPEIAEDETYIIQSSWGVCFTGDTKIKSLDGNSYSFKELVDNKITSLWVYACSSSGRIVPALATDIRLTRRNALLVEVELDCGAKIRCTPDHLFMLRDGSYKKAKDLSPSDSLMPLYLKHDKDGYVLCMDNESGKFLRVHSLVNKVLNLEEYLETKNRCTLSEDFVVTHHKDHNKENNVPSNLEWMTNIEHSTFHYDNDEEGLKKFNTIERPDSWKQNVCRHLESYNKSEEHREVGRHSLAIWKANNPDKNAENGRRNLEAYKRNYHEKFVAEVKARSSRPEHIALFKENARIYRESEAFFEHCRYMADTYLNTPENCLKASKRMSVLNRDPDSIKRQIRGKIGKAIKFLIDRGLDFTEENFNRHKVRGCAGYANILKYFDSYAEAYTFGENYNHKVIAVRSLTVTEDVYDLEVSDYHNFALDCGIFVHNCSASTLRWRGGIHTLPAGPMVKGIYTSRYKGGVIAAPDYSQQEIRTISGLANCQSLLEAYRNGEDVHMKTAMSVFKKPAEEITKNERRFCKSATFAILYGSTVPGLANLMSVPIEQAQQMMDGFFGAYPELKTWMDARHAEIDRGQKVSCSKVGYFLDIDVNGHGGIEEAYKQAGNYPVQGQSSLIAGYVLNSISQYLLDNHMMTKPISFIHDSLEFDIHPSELFKSCQKITSMMNDIPNEKFGIPSKAELTIGLSMGDENEVTFIEETENGGIIELQGFENDLDAMLENWKSVYSSVEYKDDPEFAEDVYVPRKEMFMPKLTISKYSGTTRKMIRRRFEITF